MRAISLGLLGGLALLLAACSPLPPTPSASPPRSTDTPPALVVNPTVVRVFPTDTATIPASPAGSPATATRPPVTRGTAPILPTTTDTPPTARPPHIVVTLATTPVPMTATVASAPWHGVPLPAGVQILPRAGTQTADQLQVLYPGPVDQATVEMGATLQRAGYVLLTSFQVGDTPKQRWCRPACASGQFLSPPPANTSQIEVAYLTGPQLPNQTVIELTDYAH